MRRTRSSLIFVCDLHDFVINHVGKFSGIKNETEGRTESNFRNIRKRHLIFDTYGAGRLKSCGIDDNRDRVFLGPSFNDCSESSSVELGFHRSFKSRVNGTFILACAGGQVDGTKSFEASRRKSAPNIWWRVYHRRLVSEGNGNLFGQVHDVDKRASLGVDQLLHEGVIRGHPGLEFQRSRNDRIGARVR